MSEDERRGVPADPLERGIRQTIFDNLGGATYTHLVFDGIEGPALEPKREGLMQRLGRLWACIRFRVALWIAPELQNDDE